MLFFKKKSSRRSQVRRTLSSEKRPLRDRLTNSHIIKSSLLWLLFVLLFGIIMSFELLMQQRYLELIPNMVVVILLALAAASYIRHYQGRILGNHARALALVVLFSVLLATVKLTATITGQTTWTTGTAVITAIILTIAYDQRFALAMSLFYCSFAAFAVGANPQIPAQQGFDLFLIMATGATICCFSLKEIRTRMKLLEVSVLSAIAVFIMSASLGALAHKLELQELFKNAGQHSAVTFVVGVVIQGLLPVIEKVFRITTSMTLIDFSDANQPLLRKLALEAPGTFSHSLLIGSVAEAAAESVKRNGLLCRVGAYYHDIGKTSKPGYFVENQIGSVSQHKELSPTMSRLIIVGHVKDGIEIARKYGLPAVLRQFIETHHGTTLVEYFYHEAKKLNDQNSKTKNIEPPEESEFRYPGPKPRTKEAAIVMLVDSVEGAVRAMDEISPARIETVVHNMSMRRLQDGQFDECDMTLCELSTIEASISKTLSAHYHGRIAYPNPVHLSEGAESQENNQNNENAHDS